MAYSWPQAQDCDMKDYYYLSHSKSCYFLTSAPTLFRNSSGGWAEFLMVRSSSLQMPKLAGNGCWRQQGCSATGMVLCLGCIALVEALMLLLQHLLWLHVCSSATLFHRFAESTGTAVTAQDISASPRKYLAAAESVSDSLMSRDQILPALYPESAQPSTENTPLWQFTD